MIRVLVAEDSLTVRKRLVEVLGQDPELEVVGEAADGKQAIELCQRLRPDVVTLDMMMPVMTGVAAAEYIMAYCPTPILVVSASTNRGELFRTYDALAAGAIDVLDKATGGEPDGAWEARLRATVKLVSRIKVITHPRAKLALGAPPGAAPGTFPPRVDPAPARLVGIGGSTGSPAAVVDILRALPSDFSVPILLVIHINEPFGAAFAEWLDGQSALRVRYPRDGEPLALGGGGRVLMAPPGKHLVLRGGVLRLVVGPERHSCIPSVDELFESLAAEAGRETVGCLLTGMGRDGAAGLAAIRRAGGATMAQDEATSAVFGMPREAILLGAAEQVLPLPQIAAALAAATRAAPRTSPAPAPRGRGGEEGGQGTR
jgi:two-component system chemotaxis response regulator CheB